MQNKPNKKKKSRHITEEKISDSFKAVLDDIAGELCELNALKKACNRVTQIKAHITDLFIQSENAKRDLIAAERERDECDKRLTSVINAITA